MRFMWALLSAPEPPPLHPSMHGFHEPAHVADGVEPATVGVAGPVVGIALHRRHVVGPHRSLKADLLIAAHGLQHVGLTVIVEGLHEALGCAPDIPEVHEMDLLAL